MNELIEIEKVVDAPIGRVFKAYTSPEDLTKWYNADEDWTIPYAETDPKNGGRFKIGFADPSGKVVFDFTGTYQSIISPGRIEYTIDDGRNVSIDLTADGDKTIVKVEFEAEKVNSLELQRKGWSDQLNHLAEYLKS